MLWVEIDGADFSNPGATLPRFAAHTNASGVVPIPLWVANAHLRRRRSIPDSRVLEAAGVIVLEQCFMVQVYLQVECGELWWMMTAKWNEKGVQVIFVEHQAKEEQEDRNRFKSIRAALMMLKICWQVVLRNGAAGGGSGGTPESTTKPWPQLAATQTASSAAAHMIFRDGTTDDEDDGATLSNCFCKIVTRVRTQNATRRQRCIS